MNRAAFIAGDWGTSHLRLSLCDAQGNVVDQCDGPGIAQCSTAPHVSWDKRVSELTAAWTSQHRSLPLLLSGMIGSNMGWLAVPYVTCPTKLEQLAQHMGSPGPDVLIAPGLSCQNRNGAPDVMRGEETQLIGALMLDPRLKTGRHLVCLPGTHTKWVFIDNGTVDDFVTAVTGELFAIIKQHSVLVRSNNEPGTDHETTFNSAVAHLKQQKDSSLLQLIFECRSRSISGDISSASAAAYLSGLLIASDVSGALRLYSSPVPQVTIIGTPELTQLYATVCTTHGVKAQQLDGASASRAGLTALYLQHYGNTV